MEVGHHLELCKCQLGFMASAQNDYHFAVHLARDIVGDLILQYPCVYISQDTDEGEKVNSTVLGQSNCDVLTHGVPSTAPRSASSVTMQLATTLELHYSS